MWRRQGWYKNRGGESKHSRKTCKCIECLAYESGADEMLKAVRAEGIHICVGQILELAGEKIKATRNQTLVLIPDEE